MSKYAGNTSRTDSGRDAAIETEEERNGYFECTQGQRSGGQRFCVTMHKIDTCSSERAGTAPCTLSVNAIRIGIFPAQVQH